MPTIGEKLEETRLRHGYTVDDVAHETRIHPNMIIRIEEDDFSQFPSVAYAKSFIRKYSEHLGVDLGDAMETLNAGVMRLGDNELMGEMKKTIHKDRRFRLERTPKALRRRSDKPAGAPLFLNLVLGTLIVSLGLFYFLGYNAPTAQKAKEDIARSLGIELPPAPPAAVDAPVAKTPPGNAPVANQPPAAAQTDLTVPIDNPLGTLAPASPVTPGTPPVYPPIKPAVDVSFDDTLKPRPEKGGIAGSAIAEPSALPRPRETPRMVISENPVTPPNAAQVSATGSPPVEPQPAALPVDPPAVKPATAPMRAQPVPVAE
jgi:cytoskeletal protein RodZ